MIVSWISEFLSFFKYSISLVTVPIRTKNIWFKRNIFHVFLEYFREFMKVLKGSSANFASLPSEFK